MVSGISRVGEAVGKRGAQLQLGYFGPNGEFVPVMTMDIGRLHAQSDGGRPDPAWPVREQRFQEMVERAGGTTDRTCCCVVGLGEQRDRS